jgi:multicomponent Na+:H+ antiporter subunit B
MTPRARVSLMAVAAAALLGLFLWGAVDLPSFGHYRGPYGLVINHVVSSERQLTNAVTSLVFDYRGYDTLGEELILFISVVGVTTLLRQQRDEREPQSSAEEAEELPHTSDALRVLGVLAIGVTLLIGMYVVAHGTLTPGGGFQGGVVLGAGVLLVYLSGEMVVTRRLEPNAWMEIAHSAGAAGLALLALGGLIAGGAVFHNFIDTGTIGLLRSGGTIAIANGSVGLEVAGATVLLASELLHQALIVREGAAS